MIPRLRLRGPGRLPAPFIRADFLPAMLGVALVIVLTLGGTAAPAAGMKEGGPDQKPVVIRSKVMEADNIGHKALFLGDVVAETGSGTINADRMDVLYSKKTGGIIRIECKGNVRMLRDSRTILAETAVYHEAERMIDFRGEPRILDGGNMVTGSVIRYYPDEDRLVVEDSRVYMEGR